MMANKVSCVFTKKNNMILTIVYRKIIKYFYISIFLHSLCAILKKNVKIATHLKICKKLNRAKLDTFMLAYNCILIIVIIANEY